jgi:hypothetical protein
VAENEIGDQVIATGIAHGACEACLQHKLEKRKLKVPNISPASPSNVMTCFSMPVMEPIFWSKILDGRPEGHLTAIAELSKARRIQARYMRNFHVAHTRDGIIRMVNSL